MFFARVFVPTYKRLLIYFKSLVLNRQMLKTLAIFLNTKTIVIKFVLYANR